MQVVVRQCEAKQVGVDLEDAREVLHDRDRATLAQQHRLVAEGGLERLERGLSQAPGGRDDVRIGHVAKLHCHAHGRRAK